MPLAPFVTRGFLVAATGNFLFFTGLAGFLLLPLHLKELGATERQLGFVMGCHSGTAILLQPIVGVWVDRRSHRALLVSGALLTGGVALLFAAAPDAVDLLGGHAPMFAVVTVLAGACLLARRLEP